MPVSDTERRLAAMMRRAAAGAGLTIAFIGGSITQGARASSKDRQYTSLVMRWWRERFPAARFRCVNAGVGATGSLFAAARVKEDALSYAPDFCVVEFSVNDEDDAFCQETYEGLIRRLLSAPKRPAVLLLCSARFDTLKTAARVHRAVGEYYGLECVSMADTACRPLRAGAFNLSALSPDGLHPDDAGHAAMAGLIAHRLEEIFWACGDISPAEDAPLPAPLTLNGFSSVSLIRAGAPAKLTGFQADTRPRRDVTDVFSRGWYAAREGDAISFQITCESLAVQYRKTARPAPAALLTADGARSFVLDAAFDETWGDCLYTQTLFAHEPLQTRDITIRVTRAVPNEPFYLASLIAAGAEK